MYSCLIMGSGRSGTSMMAGVLSNSGYYMGNNLLPPRAANPKGFFESPQINREINEALLVDLLPDMSIGQRWLGVLPLKTKIPKIPDVTKKIKAMIRQQPFCYKDPRFCYTLPAWKPFLFDTRFICVFRHPASTAVSIVKECRLAKYLRGLPMDLDRALKIYVAVYGQILNRHMKKGSWLFVHYDQLFEENTLKKISNFLHASIDCSFPEEKLKKVVPNIRLPKNAIATYETLCELAGYDCI